ncbi:Nif3-like dinuclear metal center hexameric protein [Candidatus Erwinia haradaeae]|uniref:GTP cyclohydrolase 1 type 2 homolog n=1 Tax=Candidatus Erwinia haradaeae TaxID=1922217 RepID=A0A451DAM5_9GAMM|nr:Nif3-like dinuclear metal center hexameric protein [Candidatus Erwinia haradaeae]VFP83369.1 GTP cyclohydrolase 1 type 2 homolog [Candidatus Erwinia haradaeae]
MCNFELELRVNQLLKSACYSDNMPNGLQIEGRKDIQKVITGVTACYDLLHEAYRVHADAVIVHHGYFWKKECAMITGMKQKRLKILLENNINLFAWHVPLDVHPVLGNNVQLSELLGIEIKGEVVKPLVLWGELRQSLSVDSFKNRISMILGRKPLHCGAANAPSLIKSIAWCSGSGQVFIDAAASFGVDAFLSGEVSEQTIHSAREQGLHLFAAGHHATERGGVKALGEWIANKYNLDVRFVDIDNPV